MKSTTYHAEITTQKAKKYLSDEEIKLGSIHLLSCWPACHLFCINVSHNLVFLFNVGVGFFLCNVG